MAAAPLTIAGVLVGSVIFLQWHHNGFGFVVWCSLDCLLSVASHSTLHHAFCRNDEEFVFLSIMSLFLLLYHICNRHLNTVVVLSLIIITWCAVVLKIPLLWNDSGNFFLLIIYEVHVSLHL